MRQAPLRNARAQALGALGRPQRRTPRAPCGRMPSPSPASSAPSRISMPRPVVSMSFICPVTLVASGELMSVHLRVGGGGQGGAAASSLAWASSGGAAFDPCWRPSPVGTPAQNCASGSPSRRSSSRGRAPEDAEVEEEGLGAGGEEEESKRRVPQARVGADLLQLARAQQRPGGHQGQGQQIVVQQQRVLGHACERALCAEQASAGGRKPQQAGCRPRHAPGTAKACIAHAGPGRAPVLS